MESLRGHLLIAGPGLVDPNFWRTVVLVGEHSEEGALGVVLNRSSETSVDEALPELARARRRAWAHVHVGGPVQPSAVVVLADFAEPDDAESLVVESVGFLPAEIDPDALGELRRARVYVGYAGWGPGQLDGELEEGSWIVEPALARGRLHATSRTALWSDVLRRKGGPFARPRGDAAGSQPELTTAHRGRLGPLGRPSGATVSTLPARRDPARGRERAPAASRAGATASASAQRGSSPARRSTRASPCSAS